MADIYTESLNRLIAEFNRLPGIGPKSAERLAFHILKANKDDAMALAKAVSDVKNKTKSCKICHNLSESPVCKICSDAGRDKSLICVVEQPKDIIALEKTGSCKWVYHVLGGHIAPLEGIDAEDLNIESLVKRVRDGNVIEVIMATNPNMAGDGTAFYISSLLKNTSVKITRLARGLPSGSTIEYANTKILTDAITGRQNFQ